MVFLLWAAAVFTLLCLFTLSLVKIFEVDNVVAAVSGIVVFSVIYFLFRPKKHTIIQEGTQIVSSVEHNKDNMGSEPSPFGGVRSE